MSRLEKIGKAPAKHIAWDSKAFKQNKGLYMRTEVIIPEVTMYNPSMKKSIESDSNLTNMERKILANNRFNALMR